ncbi:protein of unknown function [Methylorubrum extorquens]|uniref:Uncharacterized protein n=1 Tax=Methylorubrum extorquens TaxID=408 RepID=A0A2N9ASS2_METEX|nr:protein of unknown function [Methylorubrum extorquens]
MVRTDLVEILSIFEGLDPHLDAVAEVVARLERRISAALRYRDPRDSARIERAAAALRAVGAGEDDLAGLPLPQISLLRPPIGPPQLTNPRMPRRIIEYEPLPEIDIDPAIEAFIAAKDEFRRRITVTPERIVAYLDARLAQVKALRGSDIQVDDVDAFVVFQRLREIDVLFDGVLRSRYRVARIEGRVSNGWLDCPDFMIERIPPPRCPARSRQSRLNGQPDARTLPRDPRRRGDAPARQRRAERGGADPCASGDAEEPVHLRRDHRHRPFLRTRPALRAVLPRLLRLPRLPLRGRPPRSDGVSRPAAGRRAPRCAGRAPAQGRDTGAAGTPARLRGGPARSPGLHRRHGGMHH